MKNIHVLPTDKPSRLYKSIDDKLSFTDIEFEQSNNFNTNQNIYITSDETAYPYALHYQKEVLKIRAFGENSGELYHDKGFSYPDQCKKIILTTDQDLIKDGVQAIDDEFLEWFVKNPSCEEVEIKSWIKTYEDGSTFDRMDYEIIIPKEEAKQETLEEAVQKVANSDDFINGALFGSLWQAERMYSEEEVKEILTKFTSKLTESKLRWFELFGKK